MTVNGQKQRATGNCSSNNGKGSNGSDSSKGINGARELRAEMETMAVTAGKGSDGRKGGNGSLTAMAMGDSGRRSDGRAAKAATGTMAGT